MQGGVDVQTWYKNDPTWNWDGWFTLHGCYPVKTTIRDQAKHFFFEEAFTDLTAGIADPNIFTPPAQCLQ